MAIAESMASVPNARRWFHLTPGKLLVVLLAVEGGLLLSERWFPKGWAVLIAVASVGVFLLVMLLWLAVALLFRRRFQFSIRSLLVLTVAVAVPCSWMAVEIQKAKHQNMARDALGDHGCGTSYDYEYLARPYTYIEPAAPEWLNNLLGIDFFQNVHYARFDRFNEVSFTDDDMRNVGVLKGLGILDLVKSHVTDEGMKYIEGLNKIEYLNLYGSRITDAGLKCCEGMVKMRCICLDETQITDAGLEHLKALKNLQEVDLNSTKVTDAGVAKLQKALPNCKIEH